MLLGLDKCLKGPCVVNCQNSRSNCLDCENCCQLSKLSEIVEFFKNCQKIVKLQNVKMLVRSCFLITLIKCLKGHNSLGSRCNV